MADISPITIARFWSKVSVTAGDTDCWEWKGSKKEKGYGKFRVPQFGRVTIGAHRFSYLLYHGDFPPDGLLVRHKCDNPGCVNPLHLESGTVADNMKDMVDRGRSPRRDQSGEKNGNAKLSWEKVDKIKARIANGETNTAIAEDYGVSHHMISKIRRGHYWAETTKGE